jgi:hypothetical protein
VSGKIVTSAGAILYGQVDHPISRLSTYSVVTRFSLISKGTAKTDMENDTIVDGKSIIT